MFCFKAVELRKTECEERSVLLCAIAVEVDLGMRNAWGNGSAKSTAPNMNNYLKVSYPLGFLASLILGGLIVWHSITRIN